MQVLYICFAQKCIFSISGESLHELIWETPTSFKTASKKAQKLYTIGT